MAINTTNMNATNTLEEFRVNVKDNFDVFSNLPGTGNRVVVADASGNVKANVLPDILESFVHKLANKREQFKGLTGSGLFVITLPIISQGGSNYSHYVKLKVLNNVANNTVPVYKSIEIIFSSLTAINNLSTVSTVPAAGIVATVSGMNIILTSSTALTNPFCFVETISQNDTYINVAGMTLT